MATGAGHLNAYAIGILVDLRNLERLRRKILAVKTEIGKLNASFRGKGVTASIKNINALTAALEKLGGASAAAGSKVVASQTKVKASIAASGTTANLYASSFDRYNTSLLGAARGTKNAFTDMFRRVALWSAGVGLLFGVISKVRTVFKGMQDLEESMTELKKVMADNTPWRQARQSIVSTAKEFSIAASAVAEISTVWAQQGKTLQEVTELTKTAALGMNSANLTATQSVEFLTSATKAYNVEAEDTEKIINGIMRVQASYAITAANLAKGFNVAGALASKATVDMGALFGMMTAIGEVTRETGNTIGNSLKTQFARMQNPATIQFLEAMGIQMREIVKATGEIRRLTPTQVFRQISQLSKTGKLTSDEVIDIALKIGGIRKFKDALILIERFGVAEEARTKFLLAYQDAQRATDLVQENLTRKTEKLNTAFLDLGLALSDQGLYNGIKLLIDLTTSLVESTTEGARGAGGERFLQTAGFVLLAKSITGLGKILAGAAAKGAIKQTALLTGQSSIFAGTPQQRAQVQAYNESLRRSTVAIRLHTRQSIAARTEVRAWAKDAGITFNQQVRKMATDATHAGREFQIAGGKLRNMVRSFGISIKSFLTGLKTSAGFGAGAGLGVSRAAGLGAAGIAGKAFTAFKGLGSMLIWFAAIELITNLIYDNADANEDAASALMKTIDLESEATKGILSLNKAYAQNKEAADKAKISVESYVENLSFPERFAQSKRIGKALAQAIRFNIVKDLQSLKEFLEDRGILDIKTLDQAQDIMIKYRNFFKYELVGGLQEGLKILNKSTSKAIDEFKEIAKEGGTIEFGRLKATRGEGGEGAFWVREVGGRREGELFVIVKNALETLGDGAEAWVESLGGKAGTGWGFSLDAFGPVVTTNTNMVKALDSLRTELNKTGNKITLTDPFTNTITEFTEAQHFFAVSMLEAAGLLKTTEGGLREAEVGTAAEQRTAQEQLEEDLRKASQAALLLFQEDLKIPADLINDIKALDRTFVKAVGEWIDTTFGATFAMADAQDRIWKATSKFVANMEKIQITEQLAPLLGTATKGAIEKLDIFRKFFTEIATLRPGMRKTIDDLQHLEESLRTAIPGTVDPKVLDPINRLLKASPKAAEKRLELFKDVFADPKLQVGLEKRAGRAILKTVSDIIKAEAEFAKLTEVGSNFSIALETLWKNLLDRAREFGLDAGSEAELKALNKEIGGNIRNATKEQMLRFFEIAGEGLDGLTREAADKIFSKALPKISQQIGKAINKLNTIFSEFLLTGNEFVDNQIKLRTELQNTLSIFSRQEEDVRTQRALLNIGKEELEVKLKQIGIERDLAIAFAESNIAISDQLILQKDMIEATDNLKTSLVSMLSDVAEITEFTGRSIGNTFTDIAGQRLEYQMRSVFDNAFAGIEAELGAGVLGLEGIKLTPEQQAVIASLEKNVSITSSNTVQLSTVNTTLGTVNASLINLTTVLATQLGTTVEAITGPKPPTPYQFTGVTGDSLTVKRMKIELESNIPEEIDVKIPDIPETTGAKDLTKAAFSLTESLGLLAGNLGGGFLGNQMAQALGKESNRVNAGVGIGGTIASLIPGLGVPGMIVGSLLGGIFGGLLGSDEEKDVKPIKEDIKRIADNTAELVAIDKRLINAPAGLTLPATATAGGNVTYNITIPISGSGNPTAVANEVARVLNTASSNFNRVNDTLS